ncbi:MAG: homocysteine S-methyltransferase family protein [Bdellovibrionales bacterium]|nr:homocysteine S-methyltransferase family protein [Bdellovibrionales bacterium]
MNFLTELSKRVLVLDGSMGALLQNRGLPAGMAPDVWMMDNPDVIERAHRDYVEAGADIIITNTFGASKWRLAEYDAYSRLRAINAKAVEIARKASQGRAFVAGDIGPSGETVFPTGKKSFEEVTEIFYEQAKVLVELGVDAIIVETMFDSIEFRAALSAVRAASSSIPLLAHATFNVDGITDTGATPENIAAIAEGYRATAVGVNCSTGPEPMVGIVKRMAEISNLIISVQPNAGLPCIKDGKTHFPMDSSQLEPYVSRFIEAGAGIIGGCCGTTPDYIRRVKARISGDTQFRRPKPEGRVLVSSLSRFIRLGGNHPFVAIGEKMNPSGRKKLSESLKKGELSQLLEDAELQMKAGAKLLDLNVGVPLVDEPALMREAVVAVQNQFQVPLMIDSANTHALDTGASVYYGRPLLNSLNAEQEKLDEAIPVMKKHGAAVVCMTTGIDVPVSAEDRLKNAQKITKQLFEKHGFREEDVVFDVLGLVVSAMQDGSKNTLKTLSLIKEYFPRAATTLGLSNTSFGLPNRPFVHNAFLAAAVQHGLDSAIMSVTDPMGRALAASAEMWGPKSGTVEGFIRDWSTKIDIGSGHASSGIGPSTASVTAGHGPKEPDWVASASELERGVFRSIVEGQKETTERLIRDYITTLEGLPPSAPMEFFLKVMTPAIRHLGDLFGARVKFIPHLMAAAEAMKCGVAILEPYLLKARQASGESRGTVVFATVKGDIHDIGKNICILMLKNFGYEVIDLGRNVDADLILQTAIEKKAKVVALSALMTTTMMQMKVVIDAVRERKLPFKVLIGGAVVTPDFAREIAADGFSTDVGTVVSEMERVIALLEAAT